MILFYHNKPNMYRFDKEQLLVYKNWCKDMSSVVHLVKRMLSVSTHIDIRVFVCWKKLHFGTSYKFNHILDIELMFFQLSCVSSMFSL